MDVGRQSGIQNTKGAYDRVSQTLFYQERVQDNLIHQRIGLRTWSGSFKLDDLLDGIALTSRQDLSPATTGGNVGHSMATTTTRRPGVHSKLSDLSEDGSAPQVDSGRTLSYRN